MGKASHVSKGRVFALALLAAVAIAAAVAPASAWAVDAVSVWRLYNPHDGQHLLTTDLNEYRTLQVSGWRGEGNAFDAPTSGTTPVYRLYNPSNGDHLYTAERSEYEGLQHNGWRGEGPKFYDAAGSGTVAVYRLWNTAQTASGGLGSHLWTTDSNEYGSLPARSGGAWRQERLVWHGLPKATDGLPRALTNPATDVSDTEPTFLLTSVTKIADDDVATDRTTYTFQYDERGNLTSTGKVRSRVRGGNTTTETSSSSFSYDSGNNVIRRDYENNGYAGTVTFGNATLSNDGSSVTYSQSDSGPSWPGTETFVLDPVTFRLRELRHDYHYTSNYSYSHDATSFDSNGLSSELRPDGIVVRVDYDVNGCVSALSMHGTGPEIMRFEYHYEPSFTSTYLNRARSMARMSLFHCSNSGWEYMPPASLGIQ